MTAFAALAMGVASLLSTAAKTDLVAAMNEINEQIRAYTPSRFGAVGDVRSGRTASTTSGSAIVTSNDANFVAADVGKTMMIALAGNAGADLVATVQSVQSATQVTLSANAGATVANAAMHVGTDDTAALQAWLDGCAAAGVIARVPLGRTFLLQQLPLRYNPASQYIEMAGFILGGQGWGNQFALCDKQRGLVPTPDPNYNTGLKIIGAGGGFIMSPAGAADISGTRRKGIAIENVDRWYVSGIIFRGGSAKERFAIQPINARRGLFVGGHIDNAANSGQGADGVHFYGACSDNMVVGVHTRSGDDGSSSTSETTDVANTVLERITFVACSFRNVGHSGLKAYINGTAAGAIVRDIEYHACDFVTEADPTLGTGSPISIYMDNGALAAGCKISGIRVYGGKSVTLNPLPAVASGQKSVVVTDVSGFELHNHKIICPGYTAIEALRCDDMVLNNVEILHTLAPDVRTTLTVTGIAWQSGNTVRYTTSSATAGISTTQDYLVHSGAANADNNGGFRVTAVGANYVDVTNYKRSSAALDETGLSSTGKVVINKTGSITITDSARPEVKNVRVVNPPSGAVLSLGGSANNTANFTDAAVVEGLKVVGQQYGATIFNRNARNTTVKGTRLFGSAIDAIIDETGTYAMAGGHEYIDNRDMDGLAASTLRKSNSIAGKATVNRGNKGRRSDSFGGTANQASGATTFTIDVSQLTTDNFARIDERFLRLGQKAAVSSIAFNQGNGIFTVTTAAAAGAATAWNWSYEQPNL